ncbi:hypothetical protein ScPMuIL_000873 [Solemya velum]
MRTRHAPIVFSTPIMRTVNLLIPGRQTSHGLVQVLWEKDLKVENRVVKVIVLYRCNGATHCLAGMSGSHQVLALRHTLIVCMALVLYNNLHPLLAGEPGYCIG